MRHIAGTALTWASIFLAIVAILIGSPALFYITTAMIATIGACNLQAWLAVRGLRIERIAPESVRVGDLITVELTVWSEHAIRRPLVTVYDNLPPALLVSHRSPSLPIAPAFDQPIRTQYQFRALKRGHFRWTGVAVIGTDALGLVTKRLNYETATAEMTILPRPIPVSLDLPTAAGWGISEAESGQTRGAGIEPRGIRQYAYGDSLRHVHWRSTAKTGQLLVKEFEAGSQAAAAFVLQRTQGTEVGTGANTSLELMCGHAVFMAETYLRQGARIILPGLEEGASDFSSQERTQEIYLAMAGVSADRREDLGTDMRSVIGMLPPGSILFVMVAVADPSVAAAVSEVEASGTRVVILMYDAEAFATGKKPTRKPSAVAPEFVESVRAAGAYPVVMPNDLAQLGENRGRA